MKPLGQILMTLGLAFGALAASTAYQVKVRDITPEDLAAGLHLHDEIKQPKKEKKEQLSSKGDKIKEENAKKKKEKPLAEKGQELTAELVKQLEANKISVIHVNEFSFGRWKLWWLFAVSLLGLIGGALLVKRSERQSSTATEESHATESPTYALRGVVAGVDELLGRLEQTPDREGRLALIVGHVHNLQQTHLAAFVDARDRLTTQYGIGGMAELMDGFSAAERSINRAWSAASDGHLDEAMTSLQAARPMLQAPLARLQAK